MLRLGVRFLSLAVYMTKIRSTFYDSIEYRDKLSELSRKAWERGLFSHLLAEVERRKCKRRDCTNFFQVKQYSVKQFCSKNCAVIYNNLARGPMNLATRQKIGESVRRKQIGKVSPQKGKIIVPRLVKVCLNCGEKFKTPKWQDHKYCSVPCSIRDIGGRMTSPKAARGKSGIREDISPTIYFYSRWEANFARILNLLEIAWEFQPKTFDLLTQNYTPDFYLPEHHLFVEIKNFLSEFSRTRDEKFRKCYPDIPLHLLLKDDYLKLQEKFAPIIENWEYS